QLKLTDLAKQKHQALEKEVLQTADQIIVTSEVTKTEFSYLTKKPISVITNGYDRNTVAIPPLDKKFTLAHIGSLLSQRNPEVLWQVLKELIEEHSDFAKHFELHFIGSVSEEVLESLKGYNLSAYVTNHSYVTHSK